MISALDAWHCISRGNGRVDLNEFVAFLRQVQLEAGADRTWTEHCFSLQYVYDTAALHARLCVKIIEQNSAVSH